MGKGRGRGRGRGRGLGGQVNGENGQPGSQHDATQNGQANVPQQNVYAENGTEDYPSLGSPAKVEAEPVQTAPPTPPAAVPLEEAEAEVPTENLENLSISPAAAPVQPDQDGGGEIVNNKPLNGGLKGANTTTTIIGSSITMEQMRKKFPLPKRPGFGTAGQKIPLRANFFPIKIPDTDIHHYDVTIHDGKNIDKCPKSLNRKIIEELVDTNREVIFKDRPVYDGTKNIYTKAPLCFQGVQEFTLEIDEEGKKRSFKISLKWVSQVNMLALQDMLKGKPGVVVPQNAIQALDLVLRHAATLQYIPIGSKLFTPNGAVNIGLGLDVWHGYHQSVRPTQWKMTLNIDVCATAFYRTIDVIEFLYEITRYDCTKTNKTLSDLARKQFSKELRGLKIEITYAGNQRRKYRVNGLTRESAQNQTFSLEKDGKKTNVTVRNYFRDEKGIELKYPWLPCLHVGKSDKNVYIPMEGCRIIPGQRCVKKLTEDQTANMIRNTAKKPEERRDTVMRIMQESRFSKDPYVKGFGVEVDPNMMELEGRVLKTPGILYESGQPMIPSKGAWNMKGIRLYQGAKINSWGLVVYNDAKKPGLREDQCVKFQNELMRTANGMGIKMGQPCYQRIITDDRDKAQKIVAEAVAKDPKIELLVVVLPGKTPFYADLKRICETENGYIDIEGDEAQKIVKEQGLSTQCIQAKNAQKCNPMTLAQLCLKINAKMGGLNNAIDTTNTFTRPARVFSEPVIFLGADVTHPGIGDKSSPSIAAVVGSVDPYPLRYAVCVRVQSHRAEMIEDLADITKELLKQFYKNVGKKPSRIIMFRDGVSEGQFQQVLYHEMTAIQRACCSLGKDYTPAITFIVVQKRHHARFTVTNLRDADRSGNCPPGTTIDTAVCHPTEFDYYQYSHAGIQGTSRPTHYHVLWDDSDFKADELQALSFMLCHLYVRCTRSVSIPAPAYYAHHVAFRARYHLQKEEGSASSDSGAKDDAAERMERNNLKAIVKPHPKLASRMYFV